MNAHMYKELVPSEATDTLNASFLANTFLGLVNAMTNSVGKGELSLSHFRSILLDWRAILTQQNKASNSAEQAWSAIVQNLSKLRFPQDEEGQKTCSQELLEELGRLLGATRHRVESGLVSTALDFEQEEVNEPTLEEEVNEPTIEVARPTLQKEDPGLAREVAKRTFSSKEEAFINELKAEMPPPSLRTHSSLRITTSPVADFLPDEQERIRRAAQQTEPDGELKGLSGSSFLPVQKPHTKEKRRAFDTPQRAAGQTNTPGPASQSASSFERTPSSFFERRPSASFERTTSSSQVRSIAQNSTSPLKLSSHKSRTRMDYRELESLDCIANLGKITSANKYKTIEILATEPDFRGLLESWCKIHNYRITLAKKEDGVSIFVLQSSSL